MSRVCGRLVSTVSILIVCTTSGNLRTCASTYISGTSIPRASFCEHQRWTYLSPFKNNDSTHGLGKRNRAALSRRHVALCASGSGPTPEKDTPGDDTEKVTFGKDDTISDKVWEDIEASAPSELTVMKELLGINIFTYILAAAIVFFLSMNVILGPGWLGQVAGIPGTGSFTEVSDSLPTNMDLSSPENLL